MGRDEGQIAKLTELLTLVSERQAPGACGTNVMLTCAEVAEQLRVSTQFIRDEIRAGRLRAHRFGVRAIRVAREDLVAYVARGAAVESRQPAPRALAFRAGGSHE